MFPREERVHLGLGMMEAALTPPEPSAALRLWKGEGTQGMGGWPYRLCTIALGLGELSAYRPGSLGLGGHK